jgi:hypothetical protein
LTSENTKLKERVIKLDKDFSSKLLTTQSLIPFNIIHHTQHGLMLKCNHASKCQNPPRGADNKEGALGIGVQGDGRRNKAYVGLDQHGT